MAAQAEEPEWTTAAVQTLLSQRRGTLGRFTVVADELENVLEEQFVDDEYITDCVHRVEVAFMNYCLKHDEVMRNVCIDLGQRDRLSAKHSKVTSRFHTLKLCAEQRERSVDFQSLRYQPMRRDLDSMRYQFSRHEPDSMRYAECDEYSRARDYPDNVSLTSVSTKNSVRSVTQAKAALAKVKAKADFKIRCAEIDLDAAMEEEASVTGQSQAAVTVAAVELRMHAQRPSFVLAC